MGKYWPELHDTINSTDGGCASANVPAQLSGTNGGSANGAVRQQQLQSTGGNEIKRSLIDAILDPITLLDLHGTIILANTAATQTMEDAGTLIGRQWSEVLPPAFAREGRRALAVARRGKAARITVKHLSSGDAILRGFAARLAKNVPAGGLAARFGGDEFALLSMSRPAQAT